MQCNSLMGQQFQKLHFKERCIGYPIYAMQLLERNNSSQATVQGR